MPSRISRIVPEVDHAQGRQSGTDYNVSVVVVTNAKSPNAANYGLRSLQYVVTLFVQDGTPSLICCNGGKHLLWTSCRGEEGCVRTVTKTSSKQSSDDLIENSHLHTIHRVVLVEPGVLSPM